MKTYRQSPFSIYFLKPFIIILFILSFSCSPRYTPLSLDISSSFTQCYTGSVTEINPLIRYDGYYVGKSSKHGMEIFSVAFYRDGLAVFNVHGGNYFEEDRLCKWGTWGTYSIMDDIITTQLIIHNTFSSCCLESRYLIINDTVLQKLYTKDLVNKTITTNNPFQDRYLLPLYFKSQESKPDSECWLKEKHWFWCDRQKYREYKKKS